LLFIGFQKLSFLFNLTKFKLYIA